ncbi:MAG: RNA polymerase-associated protein RapA [Lentisphaeraceae bacterium]|nr:RNA polymerase-associated protein RapA [Lentisphaeraceae bacterium]
MFIQGQRWISEAEPELGLGTILNITEREVHMLFGASQVTRVYSPESAPLKRVLFKAGDKISDKDGNKLKVKKVEEVNGLLTYICGTSAVLETDLSDKLSFSEPHTRLTKQHLDSNSIFDLRYASRCHQHRIKSSPVYGYTGARVDLIPHQLYVASQVTQRKNPRVLLSDEVGLGKTVEAGLILHRKLITGAVTRVLIIVPESLVHQWFVEMFRKFNIWFTIMDEARCQAVTEIDKEVNPFLEDQLIIASQELLLEKPQWGMRAVQGEWDLTIIDEAHHIVWKPDKVTPEYDLASRICEESKSVLLLTATPEQLGEESHFARLKLLSPERFYDFEAFKKENDSQKNVAELADAILEGKALDSKEQKLLKDILKDEEDVEIWLKNTRVNSDKIIDALVDRHGPGRLIFRNTRKIMKNFPERKLIAHPLKADANLLPLFSAGEFSSIEEYAANLDEVAINNGLDEDARLKWLVDILTANKEKKFLFICKTKEKVIALEEAFRKHSGIKTVLFHEDLNLMQRDKNAVFFSSPEGASIMFCSEIGSEGRNFQFAHDLILWDIPVIPGLLEQRIGRLDRIGQTETIKIHVPYFEGTVQEVLLKLYHNGLDAFEHSLQGGNFLMKQLETEALEVIKNLSSSQDALSALVKHAEKLTKEVREQLDEGRDRLLEYNSFREKDALKLVKNVIDSEDDHLLEKYLESAFDYYGILHEEMSPSIWKIAPGPNMLSDALPALLPEGQLMSLKRTKALHDEQMMFLSWEHPLVSGMMDELLSTEKGNASFAIYVDEDSRTFLLETVFVAECVSAPELQVSRYLPSTPIRFVVNHKLEDLTSDFPLAALLENLEEGEPHRVLDVPQVVDGLIPGMLETSKELAEKTKTEIVKKALKEVNSKETEAIERLQALAKVNPSVSENDIKVLEEQRDKLNDAISNAVIRMDAVRFIWKGSKSYLG